MKYPNTSTVIPADRRRELNQKILQIIDSGKDYGITKADIFLAYTGDGGLHGLHRSDYDNFHQYTEAKKEIEQGQFFTPHGLCEFLMGCLRPTDTDLIADLTCGMGGFANYAPVESNFYGNELDVKAFKVAKHLFPEANLACEDIRYYNPHMTFDIVVGNPPFNLSWKVGKDELLSQLYYCMKAHELLRPAGLLALIVPQSFLADDFMDGGMIREMDDRYSFVVQFALPNDSFANLGVSDFPTKIVIFQKRSEYLEATPYSASSMLTVPVTPAGSDSVFETYVAPLSAAKEKVKHKLLAERLQQDQENEAFMYKVRKMLFDIKRNPRIREHYGRCTAYVNEYFSQKKPEEMKWEEWEKKRITPNKVLAYLRRVLKNQHHVEEDKIALVKSKYGLKLKAYSGKTRRQLSKLAGAKERLFVDMILNKDYPFEDNSYLSLFQRKQRDFERQSQMFDEMAPSKETTDYVNAFTVYDNGLAKEIRLNDMQKADLALELQKRYGILNWQMGSGKTLAGIAWYRRWLELGRVRNAFVVSAALAINLTWKERLQDYGEDFIEIRSLQDLWSIRDGQVVLISFNMLMKYKKHVQKWVKMRSQKIALVVDESDEMTSHSSQRTKATLACFRRVKYKLLTTGTTTRNNINELYSQLELLFNNSINMLCECDTVYRANKEQEIEEGSNDYYMSPFPAYHGNSLFKSCFCPSKATVFGIRRFNQDIFNREALERIIRKTIITRKFEEIVGRKLHSVETHRIGQNEAERDVYLKIMKEFHQMMHYFRNTGNARKDSMLRIIRQIQLMIQSTSTPHKFAEYASSELPEKYQYIVDMVGKFDERVAIGTVFLDTAQEYARILKDRYPDRPIYLVKGDVSFKNRRGIIGQFEASQNGILISTQQSLKSSVNIPSCNKVIIETMQWNIPKVEQYYFRFVRFNSEEMTEVHLITYNHTIEQNLLALLMAKERINEYIKTLDFREQADIFDEFGVDLDVLNTVIEKEKDEQGNVRLTWGEQKVS